MKRKASSLAANAPHRAPAPQYTHDACALCAQLFDDAERAPRILTCKHTFCTECITTLLLQPTPRSCTFKCPVDSNITRVRHGDATSLRRRVASVSSRPPLFRIHLKNLAGGTTPLYVTCMHTVRDVKNRLYRANKMYAVRLQCLAMHAADDQYVPLNDGAATLGALGIGSEHVVSVVIASAFPGALVRTLTLDFACEQHIGGMCISTDGKLVFAADPVAECVRGLRGDNGSVLRTIGTD